MLGIPRSRDIPAGSPAGTKPEDSLEMLVHRAIAASAIYRSDDGICTANFPEVGSRNAPALLNVQTLRLGPSTSTLKIKAALWKFGYRPAIAWELAYYIEHGWDSEATIVALGSAVRPSVAFAYVPVLSRREAGYGLQRELHLEDAYFAKWNGLHQFLALPR